jgi:hypothetical protein
VRLEFLDFLKMILPRGYILAGLFSHPFAKSPAHPRRREGCIGGSKSDDWNSILADQTLSLLWLGNSKNETKDT